MSARVLILAALALQLGLGACAPRKDVAYWKDYQEALRQVGALRTERNPSEITFSNVQFLRNFREIMFYDEYAEEDGKYVLRRTPRLLEKRTSATTYSLTGASVQQTDRAQVAEIARTVSAASGLDIRRADKSPDISIFIGTHAERVEFASFIERIYPDSALVEELRTDLGENVCVAIPFYPEDEGQDPSYLILIPGELTGILRRACIEEEFGQAFGPAADFEGARPSIFNDDQEFALFTSHDELLFRVLYDRRLKPGMSEAEAMPIVERIVAELRPDEPRKLTLGDGEKGGIRITGTSLKVGSGDDGKSQRP